jgi:ABC-type transport system involved in multi-copper enzyme maturation permease subunit
MKWQAFSKYLHPVKIIQERVFKKQLWTLSFFIAVSVCFVTASLIVVNELQFIDVNNFSVERQILTTPLLVISLLLSLYLGLSVAISVSREYDLGTLEMLLFGPVDEIAFILGNFWSQTTLIFWSLVIVLIWSNIIIYLLNFVFSLNLLLILLGCLVMAMQIIAFGLLIAVWGGKTRNALLVFILVLLIFAGVQFGDMLVSDLVQIAGSTSTDPLIIIRDALESLNNVFRWISPYAQLQRAVQAMLDGFLAEFFLLIALMISETALMLFGGVQILKSKGVRVSS